MIAVLGGVLTRIISNSCLNVFQKILTSKGARSSVVNFCTYFGLTVSGILLFPFFTLNFTSELIINFLCIGLLGALGNYFIIKALSLGELSSLAPINSYKPVVALFIAFLYLGETPSIIAIIGIVLIILGTYFIFKTKKYVNRFAVMFRAFALIFSGSEAVFIKKIILLTNVQASFFLWALSGLIFSSLFLVFANDKIQLPSLREQLFMIISVGVMQYSTNYVFAHMNVSYALALFQLSTLLSVFLGVNIFKEKELKRKIAASIIMILGAVTIILA